LHSYCIISSSHNATVERNKDSNLSKSGTAVALRELNGALQSNCAFNWRNTSDREFSFRRTYISKKAAKY